MLLTWLIFSVLRAENAFLILSTSAILTGALETWAYDLVIFGSSLDLLSFEDFLFWKYFEMTLTSLAILAGRGRGGETLSIEAGVGLGTNLLDFWVREGMILEVNFDEIFSLSVFDLLSVYKESQPDW